LALITPPTPGFEPGPWMSEGSWRDRFWQVTTRTFAPKQASKGPRCGLNVTGCRSLEAQLTSNHPMFLPPSSLDYRTEPPVPAKATCKSKSRILALEQYKHAWQPPPMSFLFKKCSKTLAFGASRGLNIFRKWTHYFSPFCDIMQKVPKIWIMGVPVSTLTY
jgi:hypothetical protein